MKLQTPDFSVDDEPPGLGIRVLTRTMQRASVALGDRRRVRDRRRSVGRRVLIIGRQARSPETRDALVHSYRRLMATTRAVIRDAATMVRRISQRLRTERVVPTETLDPVPSDPDDNRVLECASVAGATVIVTGDDDLLRLGSCAGIRIMKAAEFLASNRSGLHRHGLPAGHIHRLSRADKGVSFISPL